MSDCTLAAMEEINDNDNDNDKNTFVRNYICVTFIWARIIDTTYFGPYGPYSGITCTKMLRGLLHAIPMDPSLLHNNLSEISKTVRYNNLI
jgi:hypothetical protein